MESPVPVLFDHFGGAQPALGLNQPGFDTLLKLVHSGKAYVDISAPYRISKQAPDYPDVVPIAKAVIAAILRELPGAPAGLIPPGARPVNYGYHAAVSHRRWPQPQPACHMDFGAAQLKLALVENPAKLYGF